MKSANLRLKTMSALYKLIKEKGAISPAEVLSTIGVVSKENYEDWRFGRIPYLEPVCQASHEELSEINREMMGFAMKINLKPSWSDHRRWEEENNVRLQFSETGDERTEKLYKTLYTRERKSDAEEQRLDFEERTNELARTIAPCGALCGICDEATQCAGCRENGCAQKIQCVQKKCWTGRGIAACWECSDFPCGKDMFAPERDARRRAFARCAKEDGIKALAGYIIRNMDDGILYHRDIICEYSSVGSGEAGCFGDYDNLGDEEAVLKLLREGIQI